MDVPSRVSSVVPVPPHAGRRLRTGSRHAPVVLEPLPARLARELATDEVGALLDALVADGWRPGQLAHRLAGQPSQGSVERDAAALQEVLRGLRAQEPPDVAHAREVEQRRRDREREGRPVPASPAVRDRALAQIRSGLKGVPARRAEPEPRVRPSCCVCGQDGEHFVTREVRLCRHCVAVLATGEARLTATG